MKTDMTLSEAIILGSTMNPKATGIRHRADGASCALGAAEDAFGIENKYSDAMLEKRLPWLESLVVEDPAFGGHHGRLNGVIASLNNGLSAYGHRFEPWSRESIADWVATVEPKPEQQDAVTEETSVEVTI